MFKFNFQTFGHFGFLWMLPTIYKSFKMFALQYIKKHLNVSKWLASRESIDVKYAS